MTQTVRAVKKQQTTTKTPTPEAGNLSHGEPVSVLFKRLKTHNIEAILQDTKHLSAIVARIDLNLQQNFFFMV